KASTTSARFIISLIGIAVAAICVVLLPELAREEGAAKTGIHHVVVPYLIEAYLVSIPVYIALYQMLKLLEYVDKGKAFSARSVHALKAIKLCSIAFSAMFLISAASVIIPARMAEPDDGNPGLVVLALLAVLVASIIGTFAAVLQRLLSDAIAMKA